MLLKEEILLSYTGGKVDVVGNPVKSIGWYSKDTASTTSAVWIYTTNFVGRIHLYGTISTEPVKDADWIELNISGSDETPYLEFNNQTVGKEIRDNRVIKLNTPFTFLKMAIDRSHLDWIKYDYIDETESASLMDKVDDVAHYIHNGGLVNIQAYRAEVYEKIGVVNKAILTF